MILGGERINLVQSIEIAQLALKHRPNKNQRQRIIAIIYSPLAEDTTTLELLGKRAKKNGVAIDVINIGVEANVQKLQSLVEAVNNTDNSHFLHIQIGVGSVADMVISSPINSNAAMANNNAGQIDASMDPELAEAIRQSLEEQKQMLQGREEKKEEAVHSEQADDGLEGLTDEEIMQRAIMLSLEGKAEDHPEPPEQDEAMEAEQAPIAPARESKKEEDIVAQLLGNNEFVNELMGGIPGMTEEDRKKVLENLRKESKEESKKEDKKEPEQKDNKE